MINQREKERLYKKPKRHIETEEECTKHKKTNSDCMSRTRQCETDEQRAKRKKTNSNCMTRVKLMSKALNARRLSGTVRWENDRTKPRSKALNARQLIRTVRWKNATKIRDINPKMIAEIVMERAWGMLLIGKQRKQFFLFRTQDPFNPHNHRAIVCIIYDCFLIGIETIHKLTKEDIRAHSKDLVSKVMKSTMKPH